MSCNLTKLGDITGKTDETPFGQRRKSRAPGTNPGKLGMLGTQWTSQHDNKMQKKIEISIETLLK